MPSNSISQIFGISTFGESHGHALGVLIDSPLPNIDFPSDELLQAIQRRNPQLSFTTSRKEPDKIEILSGVMDGKTTGMPLCIIVRNTDARTVDYEAFKDVFRPGHADFSWFQKYGIHDYRGGGRSSGRETITRLIAADHVRAVLGNIKIQVMTKSIGSLSAQKEGYSSKNPFHWPDPESYPDLLNYLQNAKLSQDSLGGILRVKVSNVPPGLGDPIYEKLSANIAKAMFSIGTVRGINFGDGLRLARDPGSLVNDIYKDAKLTTNYHGGILGGVSTGADIEFDLVIRPVSSIGKEQESINKSGNPCKVKISGRHDSCHIPRLIPVIEAMLSLCLADAIQYQKLISSEHQDLSGFRESLDKLDEELLLLLWRRRKIVSQVKLYKEHNALPPKDIERDKEIFNRTKLIAQELDLDPELCSQIIDLTLKISDK
nr:chorismate synthase [Candidatus Cloacimonadota bacterium]